MTVTPPLLARRGRLSSLSGYAAPGSPLLEVKPNVVHPMHTRGVVLLGLALLVALAACRERDVEAPDTGDTSVSYFLLQARDALDAEDPASALRLAKQALRANPRSARAAFVSGEALDRLGRASEAEAAYEQVLSINPDYPDAWLRLGNAAYRAGDYRLALDRYKRELARGPSADASYNVGVAYSALGVMDSAEATLRSVLSEKPHHARAHAALSDVHEFEGRMEEAQVSAEQALRLDPTNSAYQKRVALLYMREGRTEEAVPLLNAAVRQDFLDAEAHYSLGQAYQRLGRTAESERSFERHEKALRAGEQIDRLRERLAKNPDDLDAMRKLAHHLVLGERHVEAARQYRAILAVRPGDLASRTEFATLLSIMGDADSAEREYRAVLQQDSSNARVWTYLGTLLIRTGRVEEGGMALDRAVEIDPSLERRAERLRNVR